MTTLGHQLILASAGTGKTWQLSNRFLALLFAGAEPRTILATTFTRKAASEILDRVLARLVEAIERPEKLEELRGALERPDVDAARCLDLLGRLTRRLDTLQVRTIDSFFVHLVRLFALDLELPPDWHIVSQREADELSQEAAAELLEKSPVEQTLELLRALHRGGAWRSVQAGLLRIIREWRPLLLESRPEAWDAIDPGQAISDEVLREAIEVLRVAPLARTKAGAPLKSWVKARDGVIDSIERENWSDVFTKGLGKAYLAGDGPETRKFDKHGFPDELDEALAPIVACARYRYLEELRRRNLATYELLEQFEEAYTARQQRHGAYRFEDLPRALAPRTASALPLDERELDLWYRLDGRIDHLLLDEFQDTSPIQWRILAPIAAEIAADGTGDRSFFCVGDVKQSIYAFRQAEPRLLAEMPRILPGLEAEEMFKSWRSSPVVLEAVNRVFGDMTRNAAFAAADGLEPYRVAAERWRGGFPTHVAAKPELPGCALVLEAREPREDEAKHAPLLELCIERIERIRAEVPHATIAVLMRENKHISSLIARLRRRGIDASGEGGGALIDCEAVLVALSLLHLADHPEDSAAAFHVATSRFGEVVGLGPDAGAEERRALARDLRERLVREGLGAVVSELAKHVKLEAGWSEWDIARFEQLQNLAYAFEEEVGLRPSLFVRHVRVERVEAPGGARVRVMTIHASKGLEFDAVVLPELDKPFAGKHRPPLVSRPRPESRLELVTHAPPQALRELDELFVRLDAERTTRLVEDSLSALYVALTRAARRLEVILPWTDPEAKPSMEPTMAAFVRAALSLEECTEPDAERVIWRHPASVEGAEWGAGLGDPELAVEETTVTSLALAPSTTPRALPRRSPSTVQGRRRSTAESLLGEDRGARRGTLVHHWLESLEWIEDYELDEAKLLADGEARRAMPEVRDEALAMLREALAKEEVRTALSRERCGAPAGAELEVRCEHSFSLVLPGQPDDDGADTEELWTGSIDRLVLARRDGAVVWAEVLDHKTDAITTDADLAARTEHHREQLEHYRRVVAVQFGLPEQDIALRLLFLAAGRAVEL